MRFHCVGESSCSDAIARCYLDGKPSLTIPCYGERRYGHAQDDELAIALPAQTLDKALRGMEALYTRGIRYPISYAGAETDMTPAFPAAYGAGRMLDALRGEGNTLLVGVTGSIATGKTAVAEMLEELGAATIDFDVLSRIVVEPDKPAWRDIVSFFGEQVLLEDRTLDREKLRELVFADLEKKKKLESFTHPRIGEEFAKLVGRFASEDPNAIIQVVVPLLIETNMHPLFHNVVMVYAPEEEQKRRLIERDGLTEEMATKMIRSQLSAEEKKGYCDLVVDNSGSLADTRRQVEELWGQLARIQRDRKACDESG
jgi:dephospho-CoA kinase